MFVCEEDIVCFPGKDILCFLLRRSYCVFMGSGYNGYFRVEYENCNSVNWIYCVYLKRGYVYL